MAHVELISEQPIHLLLKLKKAILFINNPIKIGSIKPCNVIIPTIIKKKLLALVLDRRELCIASNSEDVTEIFAFEFKCKSPPMRGLTWAG